MPNLDFVLPHWSYWLGLIVFPLFAMYMTHRQRRHPGPRISLPIAYLLLATGGFLGLHRFYVRSFWGLLFIPLFALILYFNVEARDAQNEVSAARNAVTIAEFELKRTKARASRHRTEAMLREVETSQGRVAQAKEQLGEAQNSYEQWHQFSAWTAVAILALLVLDVFLLPREVRRCAARESGVMEEKEMSDWSKAVAKMDQEPAHRLHSRITDFIDRLNGFVGNFVAYWALIAVFVYYYEVLARYVFNSPTNWAHESMFLMFGMQYLLAGAFALREDAHVRVDVIYMHLPDRAKALVDVLTSLFFFIFAGALLWTGWTFASNAIEVWEVSFTEWAIHYWPAKLAIPIGALLLLLQGLTKLIKDVLILTGKEA